MEIVNYALLFLFGFSSIAVVFLVSSSGISGQDSGWKSATATSTFNGQATSTSRGTGACLPPRKHFDLPTAVFSAIASDGWAVVPVEYRRVKCVRQGGMRESEWVEMINGGDQRWVTPQRVMLSGQSLSFRLTSSDGKVAECVNVAPKDWKFGETYEGCQF
uniref:Expansin n=1 Tax=Kalanchoe fedtschenkoi TaxID=63787 RepID=A0A7N0USJ0_KALFE